MSELRKITNKHIETISMFREEIKELKKRNIKLLLEYEKRSILDKELYKLKEDVDKWQKRYHELYNDGYPKLKEENKKLREIVNGIVDMSDRVKDKNCNYQTMIAAPCFAVWVAMAKIELKPSNQS